MIRPLTTLKGVSVHWNLARIVATDLYGKSREHHRYLSNETDTIVLSFGGIISAIYNTFHELRQIIPGSLQMIQPKIFPSIETLNFGLYLYFVQKMSFNKSRFLHCVSKCWWNRQLESKVLLLFSWHFFPKEMSKQILARQKKTLSTGNIEFGIMRRWCSSLLSN